MRNRNKLYNYIVNTYGIGKSEVQEMIKQRLDDVFSYSFTEKIESMIRNKVEQEMKSTYIKEVKSYLSHYIEKQIEKEVKATIKGMKFEGKFNVDFNPEIGISLSTEEEVNLKKRIDTILSSVKK